MNITNISHSIFIPFDSVLGSPSPPESPILIKFLTGGLFSFTQSDNMLLLGNNPDGKDCKTLGNQCIAEGLNTQAGFSAPCTIIDERTILLPDLINTDFYNGCIATLYNLSGNSGPSEVTETVISVSDDGTNTYLTFKNFLTTHTSGYVALIADYQAHANGTNTIASAPNSEAGGNGAVADLPSKFARSDKSGGQYSFTSASIVTNDSTPTILLANNKYLKIRNNMSYMFIVHVGARQSDGSNCALFLRYGIINNVANSVALIGEVATLGTDINSNDWTVDISADNTNKSLAISVTGDDATTIHWFTRCDCIEIG